MSQATPTSTAFLLSLPFSCKRAPRTSAQLKVGASLEKKRGFGESAKPGAPSKSSKEKRLSKQTQDLLQGVPADGKKSVLLHEDSQELQKVVKSMEKGSSKKRIQHPRIDKEVAAKGRVDFVKVKSWEGEEKGQSNLESLQVKSFSPSFSSMNGSGSFYKKLVNRLQLLESKGEISVVNAKSFPPFQDWTFGEDRYLQYLVDQHAVFDTLKTSIASIGDAESKDDLSNKDAESKDDPSNKDADLKNYAMAVKIFNKSLGLERSQALQDDIDQFSKAVCSSRNKIVEVPQPTTQTTAYVKYLRQLAGVSSHGRPGKQHCLQLLGHIFAIYVTHLTTGMRIGAKALDCLSILKYCKAVCFYRSYPEEIRDPLKVFIAGVDRVAHFVPAEEDQECVMDELPKAIQKTSLLLVPLAVVEKMEDKVALV